MLDLTAFLGRCGTSQSQRPELPSKEKWLQRSSMEKQKQKPTECSFKEWLPWELGVYCVCVSTCGYEMVIMGWLNIHFQYLLFFSLLS